MRSSRKLVAGVIVVPFALLAACSSGTDEEAGYLPPVSAGEMEADESDRNPRDRSGSTFTEPYQGGGEAERDPTSDRM